MPSFFDVDSYLAGSAASSQRRRILFLADLDHEANVVKDHIGEIIRLSRHEMVPVNPIRTSLSGALSFSNFDGILIHYSIYILGEYFLPGIWADFIRRYHAPKVQIIQDEHRTVNRMAARINDLGVQVVFSSLSPDIAAKVYTQPDIQGVSFVGSLPGYVPERLLHRDAPPIKDRKFDLIYRGRELAAHLGIAAQEKNNISKLGYRIAEIGNFNVDLETAESRRIYGEAWDNFLLSGRAMLGVEGGVSVFDFDGSIEKEVSEYLSINPEAGFDEVHGRFLEGVDGKIIHRTITPRCFEAIACRTALVLFPGSFREILKPWVHYVPLNPDGSNLTEVSRILADHAFLQDLVDRTYGDIVESRSFLFDRYVMAIDAAFERSEIGRPGWMMRGTCNRLAALRAAAKTVRTDAATRVSRYARAVTREAADLLSKCGQRLKRRDRFP